MKTYLLLSFFLLSLILIQDSDGSKTTEKIETYKRRDKSCYESCMYEEDEGKVLVKVKSKDNNKCSCKFEITSGTDYNSIHDDDTGFDLNPLHYTDYNSNPGHNNGFNSNPGHNNGFNSNPSYNTGFDSNPRYNPKHNG